MKKAKTSMSLNLSSQANTYNSHDMYLYQHNIFAIFGLGYLDNNCKSKCIPISISLNKSGELTIIGLNESLINDENIYIYSDKKITTSND